MNSKYIGLSINGFLILESYTKRTSSGSYNSCFEVMCEKCGKIQEKFRNNVLKNSATCECSYVFKYHNASGLSGTRLNKIYRMMIDRCFNPKSTAYQYYGARGITVCKEWVDNFHEFYQWSIQNGYIEDLTIDRKNNNGNYTPENCKWIPFSEQAKNSRNCHYQFIHSSRLCLSEIAKKYAIKYGTVKSRYRNGKRNEELIYKEDTV